MLTRLLGPPQTTNSDVAGSNSMPEVRKAITSASIPSPANADENGAPNVVTKLFVGSGPGAPGRVGTRPVAAPPIA